MALEYAEQTQAWTDSLRAGFAQNEELRTRWEEVERGKEFAAQVEARFNDVALTRAAHLMPVKLELLRGGLHAGLVEEAVFRILEGTERLQALAGVSGDVTERFLADVLPTLSDPRSHLLFVVRQIYRIDRDEQFSRWLRVFQNPKDVADGLPPMPTPEGAAEAVDHQFLSRVVAPTASLTGLWHERNIAEDLALLLRDRSRFADLIAFTESEKISEAREHFVSRVAEVVAGITDVHWEWYHLERVNQKLPKGKADRAWTAHLGELGFVTILCSDVDACYRMLGRVHQQFRYDERGKLRDLLSQPTLTGYRSIHTEVEIPGTDLVRSSRVSVRFLPSDAEEERFRLADNHALARLRTTTLDGGAHSSTALPMVVFTPDRRPIRLPAGATVLNFAAAIHHRLIVLARGARVNHENRGLLHRLSPGDVVWLDVGDIPRPLPRGWDQHVPPETASWLRKIYRRTYVPELAGRGRRWVREQLLHTYSVGELPDDPQLDALTRVAQRGLPGTARTDDQPEQWWLKQLGILDALEHDQLIANEPLITPAQRSTLLERIAQQVELHAILSQLDLARSHDVISLEPCKQCQPTHADLQCTAEVNGERIVLHKQEALCGWKGTRIRRLSGERAQYLVVEGSDRAGLAGEVLQTCARHSIGVMEINAVRAPGGRGLIRLRLDSVAPALWNQLRVALLHINGVKVVTPPSAAPADSELRLLPPRAGAEPSAQSPGPILLPPPSTPPFACGSYIINEKHFYGMDKERDHVLDLVRDVSNYDSPRGARIFLYGPLKTGKSSLAHAILRDLRSQEYPPCVSAYRAASTKEPWSVYNRKLGEELLDAAREAAQVEGRKLESNMEVLSLTDLVLAIRKALGRSVVLVIDEVVRMFQESQVAGESADLESFRDFIDATPGLIVIFVGPSAPVRRLHHPIRRILSTSEPVTPPSFTEVEIAAMLRAAKTGKMLRIRWQRSIPKHLRNLTGGNPYWTAAMLRRMWQKAVERNPAEIVYNRAGVRESMEVTIREGDYFADRYDRVHDWPRWKVRALRSILDGCAQHSRKRSMNTVVRSKAEIMASLRQLLDSHLRPEKQSREVDELLEELAARGAMRSRSASHHDTASRWEIGAPIFAAHIHAIRDRDDWLR